MQAGGLGAVLDAAGVFFVPVCDDLGFTRSELSLYLTFYFIATVFAMPLVGKWITKYNVNRVLSVSFALVVAAVAAMGFYTQPWQWWISGVVFGLAGSFIFVVPAPILIGNWFHAHKGLALGVAMSFSGIGGAALGPVFTLLIQAFGTSVDAFAVGFVLAAEGSGIVVPVLVISAVTVAMCTVAVLLGRALSTKIGERGEVIGAVLLLALAVKALVEALAGR